MIFAQIKNNVIANLMVLDDTYLLPRFVNGYDDIQRVDSLEEIPHIGWEVDYVNHLYRDPESGKEILSEALWKLE